MSLLSSPPTHETDLAQRLGGKANDVSDVDNRPLASSSHRPVHTVDHDGLFGSVAPGIIPTGEGAG
jgi:hypothetical protein